MPLSKQRNEGKEERKKKMPCQKVTYPTASSCSLLLHLHTWRILDEGDQRSFFPTKRSTSTNLLFSFFFSFLATSSNFLPPPSPPSKERRRRRGLCLSHFSKEQRRIKGRKIPPPLFLKREKGGKIVFSLKEKKKRWIQKP